MKKYFLSLLVLVIFGIGFAASDDTESTSSTITSSSSSEESTGQKEESNKFANFIGTYLLITGTENYYNECFVTDDGRFFKKDNFGNNDYMGRIAPLNNHVFYLTLSEGDFTYGREYWRHNGIEQHSDGGHRVTIFNTLVFDIKAREMLSSIQSYENKDIQTNYGYAKFKFIKK